MCKDYDMLLCGDGTWSIVAKSTRRPITFKGRLQIALSKDVAQQAIAILDRVEHEREQQVRDGRLMRS